MLPAVEIWEQERMIIEQGVAGGCVGGGEGSGGCGGGGGAGEGDDVGELWDALVHDPGFGYSYIFLLTFELYNLHLIFSEIF